MVFGWAAYGPPAIAYPGYYRQITLDHLDFPLSINTIGTFVCFEFQFLLVKALELIEKVKNIWEQSTTTFTPYLLLLP